MNRRNFILYAGSGLALAATPVLAELAKTDYERFREMVYPGSVIDGLTFHMPSEQTALIDCSNVTLTNCTFIWSGKRPKYYATIGDGASYVMIGHCTFDVRACDDGFPRSGEYGYEFMSEKTQEPNK